MSDEIDSLCREIAASIREAITEDWSSARIDAVYWIDDKGFRSMTYFGEYVRKSDGKPKDLAVPDEMDDRLDEIRYLSSESGTAPWGQACFEVQSNGQFSLSYSYEDCDEQGNRRYKSEVYHAMQEARRLRLT